MALPATVRGYHVCPFVDSHSYQIRYLAARPETYRTWYTIDKLPRTAVPASRLPYVLQIRFPILLVEPGRRSTSSRLLVYAGAARLKASQAATNSARDQIATQFSLF